MKKYFLPLALTCLFQIFFSNLISIGGIRPDFIIIFMVYFALDQGSFKGVVVGFITGLVISLFDNSTTFGVLPLSYSIIGYGVGFLKNQRMRMVPYKLHLMVFSIVVMVFFVYNYFSYSAIFYIDFTLFILYLLKSMVYTISLLVIAQFIFPFRN
jgi:rod shape-determining protein MreD